MGWFKKAQGSRFPADMFQRMELFGRYYLDTSHGGNSSEKILKLV